MKRISKVGFSPFDHPANLFVGLSEKAIETAGYIVCNGTMKNIKEYDCVILNWFESLPREKKLRRKNYLIKRLFLIFCKVRGKKVIAVFHNRKPHGVITDGIQTKMIAALFEEVDKIIILSKKSVDYLGELSSKSLEEKCVYIPHPHYIEAYGPIIDEQSSTNSKMKLLFFGGISPYKNIELIIEVARKLQGKNIEFWIVGKAESDEYRDKLLTLAEGLENIVWKFGFVNDEDIPRYMSICDALVLPYDESTLNSGTALLAFSYKRTIVCPRIAMVDDFDFENMYIYENTYDNSQFDLLLEKVKLAYDDFEKDKDALKRKGEALFLYVREHNDVSVISGLYKKMFDSLNYTK